MNDRYPPRILVCSASILTTEGDLANVGDEALTDCLVYGLRRRLPGAQVEATLNLAGNPSALLPPGRVAVRPVRSLTRAIRTANVVVVGGGTLLQEDVAPRPFELVAGLLRYISFVAAVARFHRRPVVIVGVGAEKLRSHRARLATRLICGVASSISTRDEESAELIRRVSGREPVVAADPMFLQDPQEAAPKRKTGRIFLNLRVDAPVEMLERLVEVLQREAAAVEQIVLVPMDRRPGQDRVALERFARLFNQPAQCTFLPSRKDWRSVLADMSDADLCIGMRLHFLIFSVLAQRRVLALTSSPKTRSLVRDLNLSHCPIDDLTRLDIAVAGAHAPSPESVLALHQRAARGLELVAELCE